MKRHQFWVWGSFPGTYYTRTEQSGDGQVEKALDSPGATNTGKGGAPVALRDDDGSSNPIPEERQLKGCSQGCAGETG